MNAPAPRSSPEATAPRDTASRSGRLTVAIQPDDDGPRNSSSPIWTRVLAEAGHRVKPVDVRRGDILAQLRGCDAFMWRHAHYPDDKRLARRLLPVLERQLGLLVYPDQDTCWHYDDKIAQARLFEAHGIPSPRTWVWFDRDLAREWAAGARYPLVLKLASGAGSSNVRLVHSAGEAGAWIDRLFAGGVRDLDAPSATGGLRSRLAGEGRHVARTLRSAARRIVKGAGTPPDPRERVFWDVEGGYALFQEFLPGNDFDTRVTVIGRRAFAYRRFNRPGDFRASGSGHFDPDPAGIDERFVRLAFDAARRLRTQSMAIDGLLREGAPVIAEISYTYVSWMVESCPGHWEFEGDPAGGALRWVDGRMWPEEAQARDFLSRLAAACPRP